MTLRCPRHGCPAPVSGGGFTGPGDPASPTVISVRDDFSINNIVSPSSVESIIAPLQHQPPRTNYLSIGQCCLNARLPGAAGGAEQPRHRSPRTSGVSRGSLLSPAAGAMLRPHCCEAENTQRGMFCSPAGCPLRLWVLCKSPAPPAPHTKSSAAQHGLKPPRMSLGRCPVSRLNKPHLRSALPGFPPATLALAQNAWAPISSHHLKKLGRRLKSQTIKTEALAGSTKSSRWRLRRNALHLSQGGGGMCMIKQDIKNKPLGARRHPSRSSSHPQTGEVENETKLRQDKLKTTK